MATETVNPAQVRGEFEKQYIRHRSNPDKLKGLIAEYKHKGITQPDIDAAAQAAKEADLSPDARQTIAHTNAVLLEAENLKRIARSKILSDLKARNAKTRK